MAADTPTTLCSWAQLSEGPFANLVQGYTSPSAQDDLLYEATRLCEDACDRRFVTFTATETQRADALDVEDALDAYVPLDPTSQLGFSRAMSLGSTLLTRHFWVREAPPRYPELWTGAINSITLRRSFSGTQNVDVSMIQYEPDTGHVRFQLGTFVPPGTTIVCAYTAGYSTIPASLVRACKYMAASIAVRELDPVQQGGHDPDLLRTDALDALAAFVRQ
ncbi:hypothetical protein [Amycolatopsis sp. CFH S0078]|uniref:hypothetical protein n=1 Tax=Amycolatopsis sp. CFH S0078 TaxID=1644108 RepID=UPI00106EA09E|nr:hypothetical protein [Amycolatopsis sp. CFH S0078]